MKKIKKRTVIELVILVVLIVWAPWYLFMGRKITGVDDNVAVGDEGTHSLVVYGTPMVATISTPNPSLLFPKSSAKPSAGTYLWNNAESSTPIRK